MLISNFVGFLLVLIVGVYFGYLRLNNNEDLESNTNSETHAMIYEENFFSSETLDKLHRLIRSRNVSILYDDPGVESAGESKSIDHPDCKHPFMIPKRNNSICAFPPRIDIGVHYLKSIGLGNSMENYEKLTARVVSFKYKFLNEFKEDDLREILGEKFLQKAREVCHKNDPINYDLNKLAIDLFKVDAIFMVPGQELPMHLDLPFFWGADRTNIPLWLLVLMEKSKLFQDRFIPQVQGITWLDKHLLNDLESNSLKPDGNFFFYPYKNDIEQIVHAKMKYNSVLLIDGSQAVHGVERFKPNYDQPKLEKNKKYYLSYEQTNDLWHLYDEKENLIKKYSNDDLKLSFVWRVHCFKNEIEKFKFKNPSERGQMSIEQVLETFKNDLKTKNKAQNADNLDFYVTLIDEYAKYPNKN